MRLARENPELSWEEIEALEGERADWAILLDKERRHFGDYTEEKRVDWGDLGGDE